MCGSNNAVFLQDMKNEILRTYLALRFVSNFDGFVW